MRNLIKINSALGMSKEIDFPEKLILSPQFSAEVFKIIFNMPSNRKLLNCIIAKNYRQEFQRQIKMEKYPEGKNYFGFKQESLKSLGSFGER